jgi:hypothetical protein
MSFEDQLMAKVDTIMATYLGGTAGTVFEELVPIDEASVYQAYRPFAAGDPGAVTQMIDGLGRAAQALREDFFQDLDSVVTNTADWTGRAADNFRDGYVRQLQDAFTLLAELMEGLQLILTAYRAVVENTREEILSLAENTIASLEAEEGNGWETGLALAGAVVGVVGTIATGGTGTAIGLAMVSGGLSVVGATLDGGSKLEVMQSMFDSITNLRSAVEDQKRRIFEGIAVVVEQLEGNALQQIMPPPPAIAVGPPAGEPVQPFNPEDFRLPDELQPDSVTEAVDTAPLPVG